MDSDESILFFYEEMEDFSLTNPDNIREWLVKVISDEGYEPSAINYIFCNDNYLHKINIDYLNHDTYTDIITFDNSDEEKMIEGEIYISIDRVKENAALNHTTFDNELHRVMAHGVLHLVGYNDKTEKEKKAIRKKEDECLLLL